MTDPVRQPSGPPPSASLSEFLLTFGVIVATIVGLLVFDTALARVDKAASTATALQEYKRGEALLSAGRLDDAIDHFRNAATLDRDRSLYTVSLAQAILLQGRPAVAEQLLRPVLDRDPDDGATNLELARVLSAEGKIDEAKLHYHRAIYETWQGTGAEQHRTAARFELIDLMAQGSDKQDLLSELLPLQDEAQTDSARLKIAHLFVVAGSPERASDMYRSILRQNPRDAAAYVGLADATVAMGNYSTAHDHLEAAQRIAPDDSVIKKRMALTDTLIAMDPAQRGLPIDEQLRRSRVLVQRTIAAARKCLDVSSPDVAAALDSVTRSLVASAANVPRAQAIEENLSIAGTIWRMRGTRCSTEQKPDEEALRLIQEKIAQ
ncbi:MAG TPA: tetratricopeptide repeat protein [Gemmatimonadaceae bacterium]|nr:tetratricopeptide repeat protein [Gemmatimonadaceae bacterium]